MSRIYFGKNIKTKSGNFSNVFKGNFKNNLTDVYSLPSGLINASNLFNGCTNLKRMDYELEDTLYDINNFMYNCVNYNGDIVIPDSVKSMSSSFSGTNIKSAQIRQSKNKRLYDMSYAFLNCKNLTYIEGTIPNTIYKLDGFCENSGLKEAPFIEESSNIVSYIGAFKNCIDLIEYNHNIYTDHPTQMFQGCSNLKKVGNIDTVELRETFNGCSSLEQIGNIDTVSLHHSFFNCSNLINVNINIRPKYDFIENKILSNAYINNGTFKNCNNLYSININPSNINNFEIGEDFSFLDKKSCINIWGTKHNVSTEMNIRKQLNNVNKAYYQSGYANVLDYDRSKFYIFNKYKGNTSMQNIIFMADRIRNDIHNPTTEQRIYYSDMCFENSDLNEVVYYTDVLNTMGDSCFYNSSIVNFYAPDVCLPNKNSIFYNCSSLKSVTFKQSDIDIKHSTFTNCLQLCSIRNENNRPYVAKNIGDYAFYNCGNLIDNSIKFDNSRGRTLGKYSLFNTNFKDLHIESYSGVGLNAIYNTGENFYLAHSFNLSKARGSYNIGRVIYNGTGTLPGSAWSNMTFRGGVRALNVNAVSTFTNENTPKYGHLELNHCQNFHFDGSSFCYGSLTSFSENFVKMLQNSTWNSSAFLFNGGSASTKSGLYYSNTFKSEQYYVINIDSNKQLPFYVFNHGNNTIFTGKGYLPYSYAWSNDSFMYWLNTSPNSTSYITSITSGDGVNSTHIVVMSNNVQRELPSYNSYTYYFPFSDTVYFHAGSLGDTETNITRLGQLFCKNAYFYSGVVPKFSGTLDVYTIAIRCNNATVSSNAVLYNHGYLRIDKNSIYENVYNYLPPVLQQAYDVYNQYGRIDPPELNQI